MRYISEENLRQHIIIEGCDESCGYIDERDLEGMEWEEIPERPNGEWIFVQRGKCVDVCCDKCKSIRIKDYAYNYTVEQLLADKENISELLSQGDMHFCPNCGADMRGGKDEY